MAQLPATYVPEFHDEAVVKAMKYRPLGGDTGIDVSVLSLGTSSLGSVFRSTDDAESYAVVQHAIKSGINLLDTAPWYGHGKSERVLGKALEGIPRQAYFLNTKCGRYNPDVMGMFDFRAERVIASVEESLDRLGIEYLDCIQVHDPEFAPNLDIICHETFPALQKLKDAGKVKFIGVTGYPMETQKYIVENTPVKIDTSLSYCHYSLNDTTLIDYIPFFKSKRMGLIGASPISMGLLSNRGPPAWHPAGPQVKTVCAEAAQYCQAQGVDISKLAMVFSLANTDIPTTLVSTASLDRLKSNLEYVNMSLSNEEQQVLDHVMTSIFSKLKGSETWEGIEVAEYWEKVGKRAIVKTLYDDKYLPAE